MNTREKNLAILVAVLVAVLGVRQLHNRLTGSLTEKTATLHELENQIDIALDESHDTQRANELLSAWRTRSLPSDQEAARSVYQHWIVNQLTDSNLDDLQVTQTAPISNRSEYSMLKFSVKAVGSLDSLTRFLFGFYNANYLHRIRMLDLAPNSDGRNLTISMEIQALILPDAEQNAALPDGPSDRLARNSVDEYRDSISSRDLFVEYKPAPKPEPKPVETAKAPPKPKPRFDESTQAFVTGIVESDGKMQAWIEIRTSGETVRLSEGDDIHIGQLEGRVARVEPRALIIESDEGTFAVSLGKSLREGDLISAKPEA